MHTYHFFSNFYTRYTDYSNHKQMNTFFTVFCQFTWARAKYVNDTYTPIDHRSKTPNWFAPNVNDSVSWPNCPIRWRRSPQLAPWFTQFRSVRIIRRLLAYDNSFDDILINTRQSGVTPLWKAVFLFTISDSWRQHKLNMFEIYDTR